jgi:hypothetical protein
VLLGELLQTLLSGKGRFKSLNPAIEVILRFVEDLICHENAQYSVLTLKDFFCEEKP